MEREMKNSKFIMFINIVMSVAIVMIHSDCTFMLENDEMIFKTFFLLINTICDMAVPSFFFISAFLFYRNIVDITKQYRQKMDKRLRTLVVPYFVFSGGWMMAFSVMKLFPFMDRFIGKTMFKSTVVENIEALLMSSYNAGNWFIRVLFFLGLISPSIYYLIKKNVAVAPCISSVLVIVNCIFPRVYKSLLFWLPVFIMGMWYAIFHEKVEARIQVWRKTKKVKLLSMTLWIVLFCGALMTRSDVAEEPWYYVYHILGGILFLLILYMIIPTEKVHDNLRLSEMTFFIYMVHYPIVSTVKEMLAMVLPDMRLMSIVVYVLTIGGSIFCICFIGRLCKRFMPRIWNTICGGR